MSVGRFGKKGKKKMQTTTLTRTFDWSERELRLLKILTEHIAWNQYKDSTMVTLIGHFTEDDIRRALGTSKRVKITYLDNIS